MKAAVQTSEKALNVLHSVIVENAPCKVEKITSFCECGETEALIVKSKGVIIAKVTICEQCGSDDYIDREVLRIY